MTTAMIRILFAGAFALIALAGALVLEATGHECPVWLVSVVSGAVGFIFGHVQENGSHLINRGGGTTPSG